MLNIYHGRAGTGKSDALLADILRLADAGGKSILLVPEHLSHERERVLSARGGDRISIFSEVLTVRRLANRVFSRYGGLADQFLSDGGRLTLLLKAAERVAPSLRVSGAALRRPDRLSEILSVISECKSCEISPEDLAGHAQNEEGALSDKLYDLSILFASYNSLLTNEAGDPDDLIEHLLTALEHTNFFAETSVFVDGYTEFTRAEYSLIRNILRSSPLLTVALTLDDPYADLEPDSAFFGTRSSARHLLSLAKREGVPAELVPFTEPKRFRCPSLSHLEAHLLESDTPLYRGPVSIRLGTAGDRRAECERTAAEILRLVREEGFRYRDILVAAPDIEGYAHILEQVCLQYGIPVYIDRMDSALDRPVLSAALSAADVVTGGFAQDDVLRYIKSGLANIPFSDQCLLENYLRLWKIRGAELSSGGAFTKNPLGFSAPKTAESAALLAELNAIRERVFAPLLRLRRGLFAARGERRTVLELSIALFAFLEEIGFERTVDARRQALLASGELKLAEEYSQLYDIFVDAADQMVDMLGDVAMSPDEYVSMLRTCLSTETVGSIPVSLDRVTAGSAGRIRHRRARVLFFLGAVEGAFPGTPPSSGFLSDEDRDRLIGGGLPFSPGSAGRIYRELETAYAILSLPSEALFLSYPSASKGEPSYLFRRVQKLFPGVPLQNTQTDERFFAAPSPLFEWALRALWDPENEGASRALSRFSETPPYAELLTSVRLAATADRGALGGASVTSLYGKTPRLTASRVDSFYSCPFQHFMRYGLRAKPAREATFDALEAGTFLHYILERSLPELQNGGNFATVSDDDIRALARRAAADYAGERLGVALTANRRLSYLFERLQKTGEFALLGAVEELRKSRFSPLEFELGFGTGGDADLPALPLPGESALLVGKIDRVDGYLANGTLYLRVVDYKTGKKSFRLSDIYYGLGVQMLVYLFALGKVSPARYGSEALPAGILYMPAREVLVPASRSSSPEDIESELRKQLKRSGIVLADPNIIDAMEEGRKKVFLPVGFRLDGGFTKHSSVASLAEFGQIAAHTDRLLSHMARELKRGAVDARPFLRSERENACRFCDYAPACQFDETNRSDAWRYLAPLSRDDFFHIIREEENA